MTQRIPRYILWSESGFIAEVAASAALHGTHFRWIRGTPAVRLPRRPPPPQATRTQVTRTPPRTPPAGLHGRHEELHPPHPRRPTPNRPGAPRSAGFPGARRRPCGAARRNFRWRGTRERGPGRRHGGQGAREGEQQRRVGAERECDHSHVRRTRERAPSSIVLRVALREVGGTWRFDVM
jgi:hypothetical protein